MSRHVLRNAAAAVASTLVGLLEELFVTAGLGLLALGFWDWWRPGAYLVPGLVLLWLFVPQRQRFVAPRPQIVTKPRRKET